MAEPLPFDRVKESSTTTGTGTLTLAGAVSSFRTFAVVGDSLTAEVVVYGVDASGNPTGEWECFTDAVYAASGTTLTRGVFLASSTGSRVSFAAGTKHVALSRTAKGNLVVAPLARTSGSPTALTVIGGAHTALAASTECIGANFNFSATKQFATGALTTQREVVIQAPTYAGVGAMTITTAATLAITGAPVAGTNATITTASALTVGVTGAAKGVLFTPASAAYTGNMIECRDDASVVMAYLTTDYSAAGRSRGVLRVIDSTFGDYIQLAPNPLGPGATITLVSNSGTAVVDLSSQTFSITNSANSGPIQLITKDDSAVSYTLSVVNGKLGVNQASPTAQLHTVISGASVIGQIIKGVASQSAVLLQLQGISSTSTTREQVDIDTAWSDSTDATRKAKGLFRVWDTAARLAITIQSSGSAAMVGLYSATPVVQPSAITAPTGGVVIDAEARTAIASILNAIGAAAGGIGVTA